MNPAQPGGAQASRADAAQIMTLVIKDAPAATTKEDPNLAVLKFIYSHIRDFNSMGVTFKFIRFTADSLTKDAIAKLKAKKIQYFPTLISPRGKMVWGPQGIRGYLEDGIRNYRKSLAPKRDDAALTDCQELSDFWRRAIEIDNRESISDEKKEDDLSGLAKAAGRRPQPKHRRVDTDDMEDEDEQRFQKAMEAMKKGNKSGGRSGGRGGAPSMSSKIQNANMNSEDHEMAARLGVSVGGHANGVTKGDNQGHVSEPDDNIDIPQISAETLDQLRAGMPDDDADAREDAKMLQMFIARSSGSGE
jgi:hypothetical protein